MTVNLPIKLENLQEQAIRNSINLLIMKVAINKRCFTLVNVKGMKTT
ncbi:hypothetical protein [Bacillus sp. cl95]|nr:hypothetical protein [Bacillus sp. cl95]